jgi:hypothetical protein
MSHKNSKKDRVKWVFLSNIISVINDMIFVYKNFLHWNISKVLISLWCFILWIIISLPIFIIAIIVWLFDPIDWSEIAAYVLSWSDVSYQLIWGIALHPYNLVFMVFLILVWVCLFLLWSSYWLFLKSELSLAYVKWKKLKYSKNYYFNRAYIVRHIWIMCWSFTYLLAPIIIWVGLVFFTYLFYNIGFIWFNGLSLWMWFYTAILIALEIYLIYRIIFWYVLLADDSKKKDLQNSLYYVKKSIEITKWKSFFKFVVFYVFFVLLIAPTTLLDDYLEEQGWMMRNTMLYNSWLIENLEPEELQRYEYISREYSHLNLEQLESRLDSLATLRFILYFVSYLLLSGIFVLLLTSFYRRVLLLK